MKNDFIVIEGNIGAGKTTLATKIAEEYNGKLILERFADNPFLPKFYKNPERYSFPLELSFLADRYNQLKEELSSPDLFKSFTLADYFFMKSLIFAKSTLAEDEYKLYQQIFYIIYKSLPKPDLYVYLHLDPDHLLQNIEKRGREYEKEIDENYLRRIQEGYFDFFKQHPDLNILIIDTNKLDFVENLNDYEIIKEVILSHRNQKGTQRIVL